MTGGLYQELLLDHFRNPRNKGELGGADMIQRGSNPRCGDEVEVGLFVRGNKIESVKFRGRGCSICVASSSMMTEAVSGRSRDEAHHLCEEMQAWFGQGSDEASVAAPLKALQALSGIREYQARHRCVLLSWEALSDALDALDQNPGLDNNRCLSPVK